MRFNSWWIYIKEVFGYFRKSPISDWDLEQRQSVMERLEELERKVDIIERRRNGNGQIRST